ncbi:unnamed protein product [Rhizoctonia solani]|uniref:Uncharacterized protein n=1 Tax=Rhizoctonia solani TaxID=456999 RepID=A0A8H3BQX7_9AGAM|nr:unnamed protein product [Rhizoctonia solani]
MQSTEAKKKVKVPKPRKEVKVGQFVWAKMKIPTGLLQKGKKTHSTTSGGINNEGFVHKQAMVVRVEPDHLVVYYATTFGGSKLEDVVEDTKDWMDDPRGKGYLCTKEIEVYEDPVAVLE